MKFKLSTLRKIKKQIKLLRLKAVYQKDGCWIVIVGYLAWENRRGKRKRKSYHIAVFDFDLNLVYIERVLYSDYKVYLCSEPPIKIIVLDKEDINDIIKNLNNDYRKIDEYFSNSEGLKYFFFNKDSNEYIRIRSHRDIERILNL